MGLRTSYQRTGDVSDNSVYERNYIIKAYVFGPYLDRHVSLERSGFEFQMERDLIQGIPQVDIEEKSAIAKEAVGTEVIGRQEKKRERVQTYVEDEAPWHRVILEKLDLSGMSIRYIRKVTTLITNNRRLRKISPEGIITTVAGNGVAEFSGEGCPPIKASLNLPYGIDIDGSGGGESLQELLDGTIVDHLEPSHLLWSRTKRADGSHVPLTPPRTSKGSYGSRIPVRVVDGEAVY